MIGWTQRFHSAADFRDAARRRLPRFAFDFIDGGSGQERARWRNEHAFGDVRLVPRLATSGEVSLKTTMFGNDYDAPFGVAPLGLAGIVHPQADLQLARVAARCRLPYIASTTASAAIEDVAEACGVAPWFQLYAAEAAQSTERLIDRVERLGCPMLVVTVDTAAPGRRLRDLRNRLQLPFRPSFGLVCDAIRHPVWTGRRLAAGAVSFPNIADVSGGGTTRTFAELMRKQTGGVLDGVALERLRQRWPRKMLLKGVLSVTDALRARAMHIDGVIVSNHGGRQLDGAPAPIDVLPAFAAAGLPPDFLMLDSGVRCGEDIVAALTKGAGMVLLGRPFLFALATAGEHGVEQLAQLLMEETTAAMRMMGATRPSDLHDDGSSTCPPKSAATRT